MCARVLRTIALGCSSLRQVGSVGRGVEGVRGDVWGGEKREWSAAAAAATCVEYYVTELLLGAKLIDWPKLKFRKILARY